MKNVLFAENLKFELKISKISQETFAQKLYTTQQTVSRWLQGKSQPDFETLFLICEILSVSPNELLGWED